ncbi:hypothetical protein GY21_13325 [Cryobacterium roopkundense]|uniref:DUF1707 domain-containing protein n=1 Tax=Cryobacterium roopkundense TaxID=1001240 RepID=A0A099J2U7_9MICO|nr:DUF1707 domain-containing protein [Cryobacterium roopkundense]KGJ72739.1 hypothetical protein GY21_13325 [Cryobacterium roopkundense]MBB5642994.1 hypothetical protein [Cryobacterium roopkundense]
MLDYSNPATAPLRLSNGERDDAIETLRAHLAEGRLTNGEFEERSNTVRAASNRGDLAPAFADLPTPTGVVVQAEREGSRFGGTLVALSPFIALIMFFVTGALTGFAGGWAYAWLWFLLIPITAIVVYGPSGKRSSQHR